MKFCAQAAYVERAVFAIQHTAGSALPHHSRHELHQLQHKKQAGHHEEHDGLLVC